MQKNDFTRLPLIIGITGHRDLRESDLPVLKQAVGNVIRDLKTEYLNAETPIVVLSSLAEGADQLAAEVALEQGINFIAPLPTEANSFRKDFRSDLRPGSVAKFDELLGRSLGSSVVGDDGMDREEQYRAASLFIVRHCHVLIALWDGIEGDASSGGTAETVTFKRNGIPIEVSGSARQSLDGLEKGAVIHIVTPRSGSLGGDVKVRPWGRATKKGAKSQEQQAWQLFETLARMTSRFNREAVRLERRSTCREAMQHSLDTLFSDPALGRAVSECRSAAQEIAPLWCSFYSCADVLAQKRQKRFKRDWLWLFSLALAAFFCFEAFSHVYKSWVLISACGFLYSLLIGLFLWARLGQHQERFLDYRALAEACRVAVFLTLTDAEIKGRDKLKISDSYPIKQRSELAWVKVCLRSIELMQKLLPPSRLEMEVGPQRSKWLGEIWIRGQRLFFTKHSERFRRRALACQIVSIILFVISTVAAPLWVILGMTSISIFRGGVSAYPEVWILMMGILPAMAAAIAGYSEQLALRAQARQYDRMRMLFERALDVLDSKKLAPLSEQTKKLVFIELGTEAMNENADWVAIFRQRPIRPPHR